MQPEPMGESRQYGVGAQEQRGKLAAIAEWQLEKWRVFARGWRVALMYDVDRGPKIACSWCGGHIVWLVDPDGTQFSWEFGQLEAQLILHLRNRHSDLETQVYHG